MKCIISYIVQYTERERHNREDLILDLFSICYNTEHITVNNNGAYHNSICYNISAKIYCNKRRLEYNKNKRTVILHCEKLLFLFLQCATHQNLGWKIIVRQPVSTTSQPVTTVVQPVSTVVQPVSTVKEPVSTVVQPGDRAVESTTELPPPKKNGSTITPSISTIIIIYILFTTMATSA